MSLRSMTTLRKVAKAAVDAEARRLAVMRSERDRCLAERDAVLGRLRDEAAAVDDDTRFAYVGFLKNSLSRADGLVRTAQEIRDAIIGQEARVREAFAKEKKYAKVEEAIRGRLRDEREQAESAAAEDVVQARWGHRR